MKELFPLFLYFLPLIELTMKIATWNVNSVRTRLPRLLDWLDQTKLDFLCLQELKCTAEQFPADAFKEIGYESSLHAQKTYNGVAILSRQKPQKVQQGFLRWTDEFNGKACSRLISAQFDAPDGQPFRLINGYFPVGDMPGTEKLQYKLDWYDALLKELKEEYSPNVDRLVLTGDLNVYRDPNLDAKFPEKYEGGPLANPPLRERFDGLLNWGLIDLFREQNPGEVAFTWFDYRGLGFVRKDGLRLDYILASYPMGTHCLKVSMDVAQRSGEKPSDHLPVIAEFAFES